jgi:hypothetical protein
VEISITSLGESGGGEQRPSQGYGKNEEGGQRREERGLRCAVFPKDET